MEFTMSDQIFNFGTIESHTRLAFEKGTYNSRYRRYVLENVTLSHTRECQDGKYSRVKPFTMRMISIVNDEPNHYLIINNNHNNPNEGKVIGELETDTGITDDKFFEEFTNVLFEISKHDYIEEALSFIAQDYYHENKSKLMYIDTQSYKPVYLAALTKEDAEKLGIDTL